MGFPVEMFTVLFAIPRTVGWLAHWQELLDDKDQKICRPRQWYAGVGERDYVAARRPLTLRSEAVGDEFEARRRRSRATPPTARAPDRPPGRTDRSSSAPAEHPPPPSAPPSAAPAATPTADARHATVDGTGGTPTATLGTTVDGTGGTPPPPSARRSWARPRRPESWVGSRSVGTARRPGPIRSQPCCTGRWRRPTRHRTPPPPSSAVGHGEQRKKRRRRRQAEFQDLHRVLVKNGYSPHPSTTISDNTDHSEWYRA